MGPLPPQPKLRLDSETFALMNEADKLLYQLEGAINILPENNFILSTLILLEAFYSTQIDDEKSSLQNLFQLFIQNDAEQLNKIVNYKNSLSLGQKLLRDVSSSSHIIKSIHKELYRGELNERVPFGEFRDAQVKTKINSSDAKSNLPQADEIPALMTELYNYIASNISYPVLVNAALIHAQFEMIHPFSGGNGLVGRILFQIHLLWKKRLTAPSIQISRQFFQKRVEYFDRLEDLKKNGSWELWIKFFLRSVIDAATHTNATIKNICRLEQNDYLRLLNKEFNSSASLKLFDLLFYRPIVSLSFITKEFNLNKQTANVVITKFLEEKILEEITGQQRNRLFAYKEYLDIIKV